MSLLKTAVINTVAPNPPKGIICAGAGVGKTTFGSTPENSIILDCENGAGAIQCQRTPYLTTWKDIEQWLVAIANDDHGYKVLAIDTIDWLMRRVEEHVAGSAGNLSQTLNKSHGGYGSGKQVLKNYVYRCLLPLLDKIVMRGIAVILLAHIKRTDITNVDGITVEKTAPDLPDEYLNTFVEWSDFVCLAKKDVDGTRTLLTEEDNRALAKNRYDMPKTIPFTWTDFTSAISNGLSKKFDAKKEK